MKIIISGHNGFVGKHFIRNLKKNAIKGSIEKLTRSDFLDVKKLINKINPNDIIVHFASVNRDIDEKSLIKKNNEINNQLYKALNSINFKGKLFFSSSTQELQKTAYGLIKKEARIKFEEQSKLLGYKFYGLIIPNLFGPFCKPNYNSFIATFSNQIIEGITPKINEDKIIDLLYIDDLIDMIMSLISSKTQDIKFNNVTRISVSEVLDKLKDYSKIYIKKGDIPSLESNFEIQLFNTFRSYVNTKEFFPKEYKSFHDKRGTFFELTRSSSKSQSSFSITNKGQIRGQHYHTRKIERFSIVKGKARLTLREILSKNKIEFILDGNNPSYVDIPIWHTHSLENIGSDELITFFWINEHFSETDHDTYPEIV